MATAPQTFSSGVIEGFYGPPWSPAERRTLFADLAALGLNTYVYAPKDDLRHRVRWRETYPASEAAALAETFAAARAQGLRVVYGLGPGLDLCYADAADRACLLRRFRQALELGATGVALLLDDIPDRMVPEDRARFGTFAAAQASVANELLASLRAGHPGVALWFCPTAYCGRMAERQLGGAGYLEELGAALAPEIEVFWTGPEIISRELTPELLRDVTAWLRRPPLIWDNLHANDYDGRRGYCGPYAGRSVALRGAVRGLLLNPNVEFPLNFVPLRTFADFLRAEPGWDARASYLAALRAWWPRYATAAGGMVWEELLALADAFYLPYAEGPEAEAVWRAARTVIAAPAVPPAAAREELRARAGRLRDACARVAELEDRALFHAWSRRAWEVREEMDLLLQYAAARERGLERREAFHADFHLAGTYRGGLAARLQRLLAQAPDGGLRPAVGPEETS